VNSNRSCSKDLATALGAAAQAATTLAEELLALHVVRASDRDARDTGLMPFVVALQQLGVTAVFLAERLAESGSEGRFDHSVREWLDTAELAVDLVRQSSTGGST
jgi:hypothetical protein